MKLKLINKVYQCPVCKRYLLKKMSDGKFAGFDYVCDGPLGCHAKFIDEDILDKENTKEELKKILARLMEINKGFEVELNEM